MNRFSRFVSLAWLALACGGPLQYRVPSTPAAPGADADITANVLEEQRQTQLEIGIVNLPPPGRVDESSSHYVVWYRENSDAVWARIANLDYDRDERTAKMMGSVPHTTFELEITAEPDASPASPSPHVVFTRAIND